MIDFNGILQAYMKEWQEHEESGMSFHANGWWCDDCGTLSKIEEGTEVYRSTIEFITPGEAKLAAFMFDNWHERPEK